MSDYIGPPNAVPEMNHSILNKLNPDKEKVWLVRYTFSLQILRSHSIIGQQLSNGHIQAKILSIQNWYFIYTLSGINFLGFQGFWKIREIKSREKFISLSFAKLFPFQKI